MLHHPKIRFRKSKAGKPPRVVKYCPVCRQRKGFVYNRAIGHSECPDCSFRWHGNPIPKQFRGSSQEASQPPK